MPFSINFKKKILENRDFDQLHNNNGYPEDIISGSYEEEEEETYCWVNRYFENEKLNSNIVIKCCRKS